jgi:predicted 3-demethylubiquinone-9 3-methyltransferase (glyoxalase superfamily)
MPTIRQKVSPCLWFDTQAEQAANFYVSVFRNGKINAVSRYGEVGRDVHGKEAGSVMVVEFEIEGLTFTALNGGPHFKFNEAVSFQVICDSQDEIDHFRSVLSEGGKEGQGGWLKDKFGLSWQVVRSQLPHKVVPCLWFDTEAEQAANFYTATFKNSHVKAVNRYGEAGRAHGKEPGSVMVVTFEIDGQTFTALNGGPHFKFNEAVSFQVMCDSQDEIDHFWNALTDGGKESQCGWLKDKFGLSWQVVPSQLPQMMSGSDAAGRDSMMKAVMSMKKFDLAGLQRAYAGKA